MGPVTVYTAFNSADAQLVRSRLDAAGIQAVVSDEIAAHVMEGYSLAAGGIRIQVPEEQADAAKTLIADLELPDADDETS